jgi:hypothetical protein
MLEPQNTQMDCTAKWSDHSARMPGATVRPNHLRIVIGYANAQQR